MRHFDVQLVGGLALHQGKIAEMRTGEGKTLVATLPSYLNALTGKGVHVVTVNDYLARRDAEWMGRVHRFLGLTVGVVVPQMETAEKQAAYQSDITYGTNNEFGFDYLRDNMATQVPERFQRGLNYAIVDEVDSILIDEARTPLIISGQAEDSTDLYRRINVLIPSLVKQEDEKGPGDYWVDLKLHNVTLSEQGHEHAEELMTKAGLLPEGASLYDPANIMLMHHLYAGVRAHALYHRDQHYVIQNDEVVIVDEFTGRMMAGRRWSDGLHQAVEAKEGVTIKNESQTLASITFQNYFRLYKKLAGMTGTADTEAFEFSHIYSLETVLIPTHRPMVRKDSNDQVFITAKEKYQAILNEVKACHERSQPVLLGTTSIENSELISSMLQKEGLPHQVLNAKQHAREAEIVIQAGRPGMITIATNMAGRGTDIVLGGNPEPEIAEGQGRRGAPARRQGAAHRRDPRGLAEAAQRGGRRRRAAHHRLRAPRVAPHRQPAARPRRPPGRPRLLALLPVLRGPAAQDLRRRAPAGGDALAQDPRGRGDRGQDGHALHRERPAQGRGPQLRHPQAAARVRRRRQRPAQGDLRAAQRAPRDRRHHAHHRGHPLRRARLRRARARAAGERRGAVGPAGAWSAGSRPTSSWPRR